MDCFCPNVTLTVLGYIVPVAEVTMHKILFRWQKRWLWPDDSILGHASLLTFCKLKILVEYFYTHCRLRWDATVFKVKDNPHRHNLFVCLFDLMRYVAVNNFSVMLGWFSVFLGRTSIKMHLMCLLKDTLTQWLCRRWVLNKHPFDPQSNVLPSVPLCSTF